MKLKNAWKAVISVVLAQAAGGLGTIFTSSAITDWYQYLEKPVFNPPDWLFGPVWTTLYALMGVALFLIWKGGLDHKRNKRAFVFFIVHLGVNALWSYLFFGLQNPLYGLVCIAVMWLMIVISMVMFARISKTAAWLLVPYLLWVSFASVLNYYIYVLNPV